MQRSVRFSIPLAMLQLLTRFSMKTQRQTARVVLVLAATLAGLFAAGCDDAARRQARARPPMEMLPPEATPVQLPIQVRTESASLLHVRPATDVLIERVQAAFAAGELEYQQGHFESARRHFDRALDWMLLSGYDIRSDPRLEALFDRLVDTVHSRELEASREGEALQKQPAEPAPIDEIADLTFPVDTRLKDTVAKELAGLPRALPHDLPLTVNDEVLSYLNFFQTQRGRAIVENGLRRAGRYREMINRIFHEEGIPQDLIYVAQAESAFKPLALSRARALGVWQFMSYCARDYGLQRTWWVDERQDPEKSTRAAARYLRDLYHTFGDWYLVLAAYNSGAGSVAHAIARTGYADFWELHKRNVLPKQTRNYVPIILALTLIAKDPARYGVNVEPEPAIRTDRIKPGYPIDLRLVAETIDSSVDALKTLNPQLLRLVTPADPEFELQLPEGSADRFLAEIAAIPPQKWVAWRRHRVEEGETLAGIAHMFRVTPRLIAEANGLAVGDQLLQGSKLVIPAGNPAPAGLGKLVRYRVRRGDTLASIAGQFDVAPADLRRWNALKTASVLRGRTLKVYPGGRPQRADSGKRHKSMKVSVLVNDENSTKLVAGDDSRSHSVRPGETLWSIAQTQHTSVDALRSTNPFLESRPLRIGDRLAMPVGSCPTSTLKAAC